MRRPCSCGQCIYRGRRGHLGGAGTAKFWVATVDLTWRHLDGTAACTAPARSRLTKRLVSS